MRCLFFVLLFIFLSLISPISIFASILFQDDFNGPNGMVLSSHDLHWTFYNIEPNLPGRWGEYSIYENTATDGTGNTFSSDSLNIGLPGHFKVSLDFVYHPSIQSNPENQHFIDIRALDNNQNGYLYRFWLQPERFPDGTAVSAYSNGTLAANSNLDRYLRLEPNTVSVEYNSGLNKVFVNGNEIFSFLDFQYYPSYVAISQSVKSAKLLRFTLEDDIVPTPTVIPTPTPSATPTPTPSATPTPTPAPIDCVMSEWSSCSLTCGGGTQTRTIVTDAANGGVACGDTSRSCNEQICPTPTPTPVSITRFSQRDPQWKGQTYDSANQWSPKNRTIESWGCALTSASTVLDYYGIHSLPNGQANNPGKLNEWLKSQPDGYLRAGAVNWNAISRLSKLMSTDSIPSLEYKFGGSSQSELQSRLNSGQPVILNEPGHFITAYQYHAGTTEIVDPYWTSGPSARTTLGSYSNSFVSMRTFTPSHTNLGYFLGASDSNTSMRLYRTEPGGEVEVSDAITYIQDPIIDPISGNPSGSAFRIFEYAKPDAGQYRLVLHRDAPGLGANEFYFYDPAGNVKKNLLTNFFGNQDISYEISYGQQANVDMLKDVSFDSLKAEIETGRALGYFKRTYVANELIGLVDWAKRTYRWSPRLSRGVMQAAFVTAESSKWYIDPSFSRELIEDIKLLIHQQY